MKRSAPIAKRKGRAAEVAFCNTPLRLQKNRGGVEGAVAPPTFIRIRRLCRRTRLLTKGIALSFLQNMQAFLQMQETSRLRARPKGFPIALWKPSAPYAMAFLQAWEPEVSFFLQVYEKACLFQQSGPRSLRGYFCIGAVSRIVYVLFGHVSTKVKRVL